MSTVEENQRGQMSYLVDFERAIQNHDTGSILRLWEEYTSTDEVDGEDFQAVLEVVKDSELRDYIGRHTERGLYLWQKMEKGALSDDVIRLLIDLQLTNTNELWEYTIAHLEEKFSEDPKFQEKMRLLGLRGPKADFQGAISHYLLLNHMERGNFVFHTAGWGVGEIMEVSFLREQLSLEFDYVPGRKDMSFKVAFQTLIPLKEDHFLAQRFGNPDSLEEKARKNPVEVLRLLLKDLGPKTAAEIKDELCELVIPETEWNKWWQTARSKAKKDTRIENPENIKSPFLLLKAEIPHEQRLQKALENKPDANTLIQMVYSFMKDFSDTLKNKEFRASLLEKLKELFSFQEVTADQELQLHFLIQDLSGEKHYQPIPDLLSRVESIEDLVSEIPIQAFKKRALVEVRKHRENWQKIFLNLLFTLDQAPLRDYILGELINSDAKEDLEKRIRELAERPQQYPEMVIWYFQKILANPTLPMGDNAGKLRFFETFLINLSSLEQTGERRDLIKKMHGILSEGRYAIVRELVKIASTAEVKEFLLLTTKCHSLSEHDLQIFQSLAEVEHPSLAKKAPLKAEEEEVIWSTPEGYTLLQKKIEQIGTVETVENAKEIEVARSHGDLRENAEFKAALEKRDRLQSELKFLSDQLNKCRILVKEEIDTSEVSVGTVVECESAEGEKITYTLLSPWDADIDQNILSFQSKLAQQMRGLKKGDTIDLQGKTLTIMDIRSAL